MVKVLTTPSAVKEPRIVKLSRKRNAPRTNAPRPDAYARRILDLVTMDNAEDIRESNVGSYERISRMQRHVRVY